jgi:hypothetical protein
MTATTRTTVAKTIMSKAVSRVIELTQTTVATATTAKPVGEVMEVTVMVSISARTSIPQPVARPHLSVKSQETVIKARAIVRRVSH